MSSARVSERFPVKVELHVHMDGAMRYQTVLEVAKQRGIDLQCETVEDLKKKVMLQPSSSLEELLMSFTIFGPVFSGSRDAVFRMAYEFCEDCAKQGTKYVEARYSPHLLSNAFEKPVFAVESGNFTPRDVVNTISEGLEKGSQDFGITAKGILCCIRDHPEWSLEIAQLVRDFRDVVAIDIADAEHASGNDPNQCPHKLAFRDVENAGLHRTAHAGEVGPPSMVYEALNDFHAERIGHGYRSLECKDLYARLLKQRTHLECCPISSIYTGGAPGGKVNHPIQRFAKDSVNFSLSTDDPICFNSTLSDDFVLARELGLTDEQITQSIFNAARSAFCSEAEKKELLKELVKVYGDRY